MTIYIEEPATDDRTASGAMAYRVEMIDGKPLFPDEPIIAEPGGTDGEGPSTLFVLIRQAKLCVQLRVIPVDAGGNEGPPSNVIRIRVDKSGCSVWSAHGVGNLLPSALLLSGLAFRRRWRACRGAERTVTRILDVRSAW